jgi:serine/threonine protein kinase
MPIPAQLAPLLSPTNITDIVNIPDGNFGDMVAVKTKPQFAARKNSTKSLGIKLYFFENKAENTFTKTFVYSKDDEPESVLMKILSEVYYHKKFNNFEGICKFKAPKLIAYGYVQNANDKIDLSNSFMFYIKMERIDALQVSKLTGDDASAKCKAARSKLAAINECLEENHLYHNDLHADNVMLNEEGEIVIIDFGEATDKLTKFVNFDKFCSKFEPAKNGGRKSRKQIKVIKRGATKRRPAKKMRRTIKRRRYSRRARK